MEIIFAYIAIFSKSSQWKKTLQNCFKSITGFLLENNLLRLNLPPKLSKQTMRTTCFAMSWACKLTWNRSNQIKMEGKNSKILKSYIVSPVLAESLKKIKSEENKKNRNSYICQIFINRT